MIHDWNEFLSAWPLFRESLVIGALLGAALGAWSNLVVGGGLVFVGVAVAACAACGAAIGLATVPSVADLVALAGAIGGVSILAGIDEDHPEPRIGWVYAAALAGTILVGSRAPHEQHQLEAMLYGNALLIAPETQRLVVGILVGTALLALLGRSSLMFALFEPAAALVQGLPVRRLRWAVLVALALGLGGGARALGVLPVYAFTLLPALVVRPWLAGTLACTVAAAFIGVAGSVAGFVVAFLADLPVGATQTVILLLVTLASGLVRQASDLVSARLRSSKA